MSKIPTIEEFFNGLNKENMALVDAFYDTEGVFIDPMVTYKRIDQIRAYYARLYSNVDTIHFDFIDHLVKGDAHTLIWRMTLTAGKFNQGKPLVLDGVSHITFGGAQGKAVYHRDYFDMGAFVYEGLPVLGSVIRVIKKKMSGH